MEHELGVRAPLTWPLGLLAATQGLALERSVIGAFTLENVVNDPAQLLRHDAAGDRFGFAAALLLIEGLDFRVVLDRPDRSVGEGDLEGAVAILAVLVPGLSAGVTRTRNESGIREEMLHRWESADAIDLQINGEGVDASDSRDPQEVL